MSFAFSWARAPLAGEYRGCGGLCEEYRFADGVASDGIGPARCAVLASSTGYAFGQRSTVDAREVPS